MQNGQCVRFIFIWSTMTISMIDALPNDLFFSRYLRVSHKVVQADNIWSACEVLQDLDFTLNLLLLDGLQDLDAAFLVVDNIDALKDLGIFASAHLANDFVNLLSP